jgi:hypothetical protein
MDPELAAFLAPYPAQAHALILQARELILSVMPEAVEQFDPSANLIGYGSDRSYKGLVCGIIIYPAYLNLMLAQGASLPDPHGLLLGSGKKARHVRIRQAEDLTAPGVRELLQAALQFHSSA